MNRHIAIDVDRKMTLAVLALIAATLSLGCLSRVFATIANPGGNACNFPHPPLGSFVTGSRYCARGKRPHSRNHVDARTGTSRLGIPGIRIVKGRVNVR
jgi:hypothetical protein